MKRNLPILLFSLTIFMSCNKLKDNIPGTEEFPVVELTKEEFVSIAFDNPKTLTDTEISELVKGFLSHRSNNIAVKSSPKISIDREAWKSMQGTNPRTKEKGKDVPPIFKVELETEKKRNVLWVSADERFATVTAHYEVPDDAKLSDINDGSLALLEATEELIVNEIEKIEIIKDSLRTATLEKLAVTWGVNSKELEFEKIKERIKINGLPQVKAPIIRDPYTLGTPVQSHGPFLFTRWSKGMPYNRLMAQVCPSNWLWDNRYAISSVVVATSQVLAFLQPSMTLSGTTMNWEYLTENQEIHEESDYFGGYVQDPLARRNMVATLMRDVGSLCGVSYTCTGASVNFNNVRSFLTSRGIAIGTNVGMNIPVIKSSVENIKPVIMYGQTSSGGGHWWVVDGTYVTTGSSSYIPGYNVYIHANMSEGAYYSGYYLVGTSATLTFETGFATFSKNFQAYPNIDLL